MFAYPRHGMVILSPPTDRELSKGERELRFLAMAREIRELRKEEEMLLEVKHGCFVPNATEEEVEAMGKSLRKLRFNRVLFSHIHHPFFSAFLAQFLRGCSFSQVDFYDVSLQAFCDPRVQGVIQSGKALRKLRDFNLRHCPDFFVKKKGASSSLPAWLEAFLPSETSRWSETSLRSEDGFLFGGRGEKILSRLSSLDVQSSSLVPDEDWFVEHPEQKGRLCSQKEAKETIRIILQLCGKLETLYISPWLVNGNADLLLQAPCFLKRKLQSAYFMCESIYLFTDGSPPEDCTLVDLATILVLKEALLCDCKNLSCLALTECDGPGQEELLKWQNVNHKPLTLVFRADRKSLVNMNEFDERNEFNYMFILLLIEYSRLSISGYTKKESILHTECLDNDRFDVNLLPIVFSYLRARVN